MADDVLHVGPARLSGAVAAPPSKSVAHRALLCAWLAGDVGLARGVDESTSKDVAATLRCLRTLGRLRPGNPLDRRIGGDAFEPTVLDCGESGTTLRLLVPLVAALGRTVSFTGQGRLPSRPIGEYLAILNGRGVLLLPPPEGGLPLGVRGRLLPGVFRVPGGVSSQYVSGLLLALPLLSGDSEIRVEGRLESAPYVDLTLQVMAAFGVRAERIAEGTMGDSASGPEPAADPLAGGTAFRVPGGQTYRPTPYDVEGDWSNAAFWLAADHLGSSVSVGGLSADSVQGDRAVADLLARFAAAKPSTDGELVVDASQIPDLVPVLAVAAVACERDVRFANAARLRLKESDRLASTLDALARIGAEAEATEDGLRVHGRGSRGGQPLYEGGEADASNDHRIAMALAVAALRSRSGVAIRGASCVAKSYPSFFEEWKRLGGEVHGLDHR